MNIKPFLLSIIAGLASVLAQAQLTLDLDPADYNGHNVSCAGNSDGAIDLTISGGTPPYQVEWSTGASTEDVIDLAAGYYRVGVSDNGGNSAWAEITLSEPDKLVVEMLPFEYGNGYNVSCYNCYNGSIAVTTTGGVPPYGYQWRDGATTEDRTNLGSDNHSFEMTDANGCQFTSEIVYLRQPDRNDWTMNGNYGTNPGTNYIGTSDSKDVVFKSNGTERFRLLANGQVKFTGMGDGFLRSGGGGLIDALPMEETLMPYDVFPFWRTDGNYLNTVLGTEAFLGTRDNTGLKIKTNDQQRMIVSNTGRIFMGEDLDNAPLGGTLNLRNGWSDWVTLSRKTTDPNDDGRWHIHNPGPDQDRLMFYFEDQNGNSPEGNLALWNNGKVSIGDVDVNTPDYDYGLYLHKGLLTEKVKVALKNTSQWADHVLKPGYRLMPLDEVQAFISQYGHLPGVPSAECMVEEGLDVVKTNALLMEKVEELTLYMMAMEKRLRQFEIENAELKDSLSR